jgi:hypothetical protein
MRRLDCVATTRAQARVRRVTDDELTGPYYIVLDVAIRDVAQYLTYMEQVTPALEAAGGRYLARGGALTTYEGDWHPPREQ